MTPVPSQRPLRSGPCLWGPLRVRAGLSLRDLEAESGIPRGILSRVERGRIIPTPDELERVMAALRRVEP